VKENIEYIVRACPNCGSFEIEPNNPRWAEADCFMECQDCSIGESVGMMVVGYVSHEDILKGLHLNDVRPG
jgi:hypothetical protein